MRRVLVCAVIAATLLGAGSAVSSAFAKDKPVEPSAAEKDFGTQYASDDAAERTKAVELLFGVPDAVKLQLISTRVIPKEKRADVLARAVEVLAKIKDESVAEKLCALARSGPPDVRCLYVEAMAAMPWSGAAHRALLQLLRDKETWVRGMAAYALGEHRSMDALDPLVAALDDRAWQVQAAALAAMPRLSDKEVLKAKAVPKLVEFLDVVSGRLRDDCADTLKRITGQNLGKDSAPWRVWLAGGTPAKPGETKSGDTNPGAGGSEYSNQAEKPHFYGMEVTSTRFVIVFDKSLSMIDPIEIDRERLRRETSRRRAVTGESAPKPGEDAKAEDTGYDIPWWKIKTRLDLARYQTMNLIAGLAPEQNFELILFSTKVEPWMNRLVPASQANKQKAIALIEGLKPDGETNTWGALAAAFEMSADSVRTGGGGAPDEIYFVTDGAPSKGDILDGNQIYDAVMQLAKVHQMRVNVIGIGVNLTFLRKMAVSTGGQCKFF